MVGKVTLASVALNPRIAGTFDCGHAIPLRSGYPTPTIDDVIVGQPVTAARGIKAPAGAAAGALMFHHVSLRTHSNRRNKASRRAFSYRGAEQRGTGGLP